MNSFVIMLSSDYVQIDLLVMEVRLGRLVDFIESIVLGLKIFSLPIVCFVLF